MDFSFRQLENEPAVHRTEAQFPFLRTLPGSFHMIQDPADLGPGEIGVHHQTGFSAESFPDLRDIAFQFFDHVSRAAALPDDGTAHRLSGFSVPDDGGLPLVGDAESRDVLRPGADFFHGAATDEELGLPDLVGIVFHPARFWIVLGELPLRNAADLPLLVEEYAAVAGGP